MPNIQPFSIGMTTAKIKVNIPNKKNNFSFLLLVLPIYN
jgi:hypothetical protein